MKSELLYRNTVEGKADTLLLENKAILSSDTVYNEDDNTLEIKLEYQGFTALLYYSDVEQRDYCFLENENLAKSLIAKFRFPYSDILYSIYDVHNAVSDSRFDTYCFHCLYNEQDVIRAIDSVIAFINRNLSGLTALNDNEQMKNALDSSFDNGLCVASKNKITRQMLIDNPSKYYPKHDFNLYILRSSETAFTNHIYNGKVKALQQFYKRESKHNHLLTFEERYLEYLFENDFSVANEEVVKRVKCQEKTSGYLNRVTTITSLLSLLLGMGLTFLIEGLVKNRLEQEYYLLLPVEISSFLHFAFYTMSFSVIIYEPVKRIVIRRRKEYDNSKSKTEKRINVVLAVIGVVLVFATSGYVYLSAQKTVGINEESVYYCQKIGNVEILSLDEVKFYMIEGYSVDDSFYDAYGDKRIVVVRDNGDYVDSDYLDSIDVPKSLVNSLDYEASFKTLDDFCEYIENADFK